ncbi:MAG TPA: hypothetical protein P5320_11525 [Bacteroidales bacterium]|nr:hypothetical protein [Bacteroidales bacterium]HOK75609.1 hypothetical protein [Bacteroidales bacterium]HPP93560.1 hypothetical protein [Bacteroidales bacterium]HQG56993.1 hypothetical protein [Bacteroidales bacterium]HQK72034.1 hypothetical protein [Bacteroidales bacterium]
MKEKIITLLFAILAVITLNNCRESKKGTEAPSVVTEEISAEAGLLKIGNDIITEVILKPELSGDPWEAEKIKGFYGEQMFLNLLNKIKHDAIKVYDCITGEEIAPKDAKRILQETGSDISRIGKIQFTEDWYFNPSNNMIIKKVKSISFGYETKRNEGLPPAYVPYFQIRPE